MSKTNDKPASKRGQRRDPRHAEIERLLREAEGRKPKIELSYQAGITVRREVTRLSNLAGTRRLKSHAQTFARAAAVLPQRDDASRRRGEMSVVTLLRWLRACAAGLDGPKPEPKPKAATKPKTAAPAHTLTRFNVGAAAWLKPLGLLPGDEVHVKPAPRPRPRQIIIMHRPGAAGGLGIDGGRFVRFEPFEDDGGKRPGITLTALDDNDEEESYDLSIWVPYAITDIKPGKEANGAQIAKLRDKLAKLNDEEYQWATVTRRAELEREIYNLETGRAGEAADEWEGFDLIV